MAGFNTIELALFIRATNTTLITQAKAWLSKHCAANFSRHREFIRDDDPDDQPARFIGIAFTTDPGTAAAVKRLVAQEADAEVRMSLRNRQKLKDLIKAELAARGWRVKP